MPDADLGDQEPDHPAEHLALRPDTDLNRGGRGNDLIADRPVHAVVVFPAKKIVVHAGYMRLRRIERCKAGFAINYESILAA